MFLNLPLSLELETAIYFPWARFHINGEPWEMFIGKHQTVPLHFKKNKLPIALGFKGVMLKRLKNEIGHPTF